MNLVYAIKFVSVSINHKAIPWILNQSIWINLEILIMLYFQFCKFVDPDF
jgi:hypothetical protein